MPGTPVAPGVVVWPGNGLRWYVMVRQWSETVVTTLSDRFDTSRRFFWSGHRGCGRWKVVANKWSLISDSGAAELVAEIVVVTEWTGSEI